MKYILTLLLLLLHTSAGRQCGSITTYWGQNGGEFSLKETCATGRFGHVNIASLFKFGGGQTPAFNLAGHCNPSLNNCAFLSEEVEYCQLRRIKVLISIGGGDGNYTLITKEDAVYVATYLWNNFLGGKRNSTARPLGAAVLDGVDLAISQGSPEHYPDLVTYLRSMDKTILISGAPFCPFPSKYLGPSLGSTQFDYVWVQFSKNPGCEYNKNSSRNLFRSWGTWTSSQNVKSAKIYLGLMAADGFASGYIPADVLTSEIIPVIKNSSKYGGVMLWSEYWDEQNHNYSAAIFDSVTSCTK